MAHIALNDFTLARQDFAATGDTAARKDMRHAAVVLGLDTGQPHGPGFARSCEHGGHRVEFFLGGYRIDPCPRCAPGTRTAR